MINKQKCQTVVRNTNVVGKKYVNKKTHTNEIAMLP